MSNGQVVGDSCTATGLTHAFSWTEAGGMVDLDTLGGTFSNAFGVDGGQVVGMANLPGDTTRHPFSWTEAGGMVDLGTLGGDDLYHNVALGVSNGQVVGQSAIAGAATCCPSGCDAAVHAFSWTQAGGMADLGTLGGTCSSGQGVSNGQVVGWSFNAGEPTIGFLWTQADGMTSFAGTLGLNDITPYGIEAPTNASLALSSAIPSSLRGSALRTSSAPASSLADLVGHSAGASAVYVRLVPAPVCGNGVVDAGEQCDDGNLVDGDGCDSNCAPTGCGNGVVTTGEQCDDGNAVSGDGCNPDCTVSFCAGGTTITGPSIMVSHLGPPLGDKKVVFKGKLVFAPGVPAVFDPSSKGAQAYIEDLGSGDTAVFNLTALTKPVPAGGPGSGCDLVRDGWKVNSARTTYTYKNKSNRIDPPTCTAGSANGLTLVKFKDNRTRKGEIAFEVKTKNSTLATPVGPLRATIVLGATSTQGVNGACGIHAFPALTCAFNARRTTLTCK